MDFKIAVLALAVLVFSCQAVPAELPTCACGRIYAPVCGSDWVTSNNHCEFMCRADFVKRKFGHELRVLRPGRCESTNH